MKGLFYYFLLRKQDKEYRETVYAKLQYYWRELWI